MDQKYAREDFKTRLCLFLILENKSLRHASEGYETGRIETRGFSREIELSRSSRIIKPPVSEVSAFIIQKAFVLNECRFI